MSEYYTRPDDPVAGTRIRVAKIKEILDSIDDGFDEIPADLVSIAAEVIAARDGKDALLDQIDELQADILSNTNDIAGLGDAELPGQTGKNNALLTTNGTVSSWVELFGTHLMASPEWAKTVTYSSGDISTIVYASGTERYRKTYTYTSGVLTSVVYAYSSNSGSSYTNLGTETLTYTDGNLTSTSWAEA